MKTYPGTNITKGPQLITAIKSMERFCKKNKIAIPSDYKEFLYNGFGGVIESIESERAFDLRVEARVIYGICNNPPNGIILEDIWRFTINDLPFRAIQFAQSDVFLYYVSLADD